MKHHDVPGALAAAVVLALVEFAGSFGGAQELIPEPSLDGLEEGVRESLTAARLALLQVLENPEATAGDQARLYGETGKIFHAHHSFEVAESCYRNAARLDPVDLQWPYLLGFLYQDSGRLQLAMAEYETVLRKDAEHSLATLRLAQVRIERMEFDAARTLLEKIIDQEELEATVHAALGRIALASEEYARAAEHYQKALTLQPAANRLHTPLVLVFRHLGEIDKAREHAALVGQIKVTLVDPLLREVGSRSVSSEMYLTTAAQAIKAGRLGLAEQAYRGAIALNPDNPRAHLNLAVVLADRGAYDEAERAAREALRLDPESFFAYFNLGNIFEKRGDLDKAVSYYQVALEKDSVNVKANFRLGAVLMRLEDYVGAAERFNRALEISPSFLQAGYLEALALIAQGNYSEAQLKLEEATRVHPDRPELLGPLARLLATSPSRTTQDSKRALRLAEDLVRSDKNMEHLEILAIALAASERFEEAVSIQQEVLESSRRQATASQLRHLTYNLERYRGGQASDRPWGGAARWLTPTSR